MSVYDRAPRLFSFQKAVGTDATIGPGAYEYGTFGTLRIKPEGYAPFNSLAPRDTFLLPGDQVAAFPGPGQYDLSLNAIERKGVGSIRNKAERFEFKKSDAPGPGAYTIETKWASSRCISAKEGKKAQPKYPPNFKTRPPTIPIPGQAYGYEETDDGTLVKQDPPDRDLSLGPAFYNPTVQNTYATNKYKGCHWGKDNANRTCFLGAPGPGPGEYDPQLPRSQTLLPSEKNNLEVLRFMDKIEKNAIKDKIPGPGSYEIPSGLESHHVKYQEDGNIIEFPPFGTHAHRFHSKLSDIPGPGSYNDPRNALQALRKLHGMKQSPFGCTAVRFTGLHDKFIPGPGTYNTTSGIASESMRQAYLASMRKGAFGSTALRLQPMAKLSEVEQPGPGHYQVKDPSNYKIKYSQPLSSMFASLTNRDFNPADEEKVAPGSYEVAKSFSKSQGRQEPKAPRNPRAKLRNRSFVSSSKRFQGGIGFKVGDENTPAPNAYAVSGALSDKGGKFSSQDVRFKINFDDIPGPGHYEVTDSKYSSIQCKTHNITLGAQVQRNPFPIHPVYMDTLVKNTYNAYLMHEPPDASALSVANAAAVS